MRKITFILFLLLTASSIVKSQYFPPISGNNWDTINPSTLGYCQSKIDTLYNFLETRNTKGFIILKDGKIVLEKYFGNFTKDSIRYWASAGKSLTAILTGIAQDKGFINIDNPVSTYLGSGWTSAPANKESAITVKHLLEMTSGLKDNPTGNCDNEDPDVLCLQYLTDTNTRWAYHTGAYKQLQNVISSTSGLTYNAFTNTYLGSKIGMFGIWVDGIFYSKTRAMARFGLLSLNKGIWQNDTLLKSTLFYNSMINTSQSYNKAYGYLWWLNGKSSFQAPGIQFVFNGSLMPNAPSDMFSALGKNDQKIYVVPSQNMVVVRNGESAYGIAAAFSPFDNELWGYIKNLSCSSTGITTSLKDEYFNLYPNPTSNNISIHSDYVIDEILIENNMGQTLLIDKPQEKNYTINLDHLPKGLYFLKARIKDNLIIKKLIKN